MGFNVTTRIAAERVRSLVWEDDTLVDWVAGGVRYQLDGSVIARPVNYAFPFDAACSSPSNKYAVIYVRCGTKGLVLKEGQILREIERSFYHADVYEYPVCLAQRASGQEVLIHCPERYNKLEIEDLETGERLTESESREPCDFFHSRLAANLSGSHFLSAGWIWAPVDAVGLFSIEDAISDPSTLDSLGRAPSQGAEVSAAAFVGEGSIVVATSEEQFWDDEDFDEDPNLFRPSSIAVWDFDERVTRYQTPSAETPGTLMGVNEHFVIGFYENPKLIDVRTGSVLARLDIDSGKQATSIIRNMPIPPLALDPVNRRFAIATPTEIVVAEVSVPT